MMKPRVYNPDQKLTKQTNFLRQSRSKSPSNGKSIKPSLISPPNPRQIILRLVDYIDARLGNKLNALTGLINKNKRELKQAQQAFSKVEKEAFSVRGKISTKAGICDDIRDFFKVMKTQMQEGKDVVTLEESKYDLRTHLNPAGVQKYNKGANKENKPFVLAKGISKVGPSRSKSPISKLNPKSSPQDKNPLVLQVKRKNLPLTPQKPSTNKSALQPRSNVNPRNHATPKNCGHGDTSKLKASPLTKKSPNLRSKSGSLDTNSRQGSGSVKLRDSQSTEISKLIEQFKVSEIKHLANDYDSSKPFYRNNQLDFLEKAITEQEDEESEQTRPANQIQPELHAPRPKSKDKEEDLTIKDLMNFYEDIPSKQPKKSKFVRLRDQNKYMSLKRGEESKGYLSGLEEEDLKFFMRQSHPTMGDQSNKNLCSSEKKDKQRNSSSKKYFGEDCPNTSQDSNQKQEFTQNTSKDDSGAAEDNEDQFEKTKKQLKSKLDEEGRQINCMLRETERLLQEKNMLEHMDENSSSRSRSEVADSESRLMKEIELEKLEVARMLENMMMSNTSVRDNHAVIENIFKKYQFTDSDKKFQSDTSNKGLPTSKFSQQQAATSNSTHVIMVDENFLSFNHQFQASTSDLSNCKLTLVEVDKKEQNSLADPTRDPSASESVNLDEISNDLSTRWNKLSMDHIRKPFSLLKVQKNRDEEVAECNFSSKDSSNPANSSRDEMNLVPCFRNRSTFEKTSEQQICFNSEYNE